MFLIGWCIYDIVMHDNRDMLHHIMPLTSIHVHLWSLATFVFVVEETYPCLHSFNTFVFEYKE